MLLKRMAAIFSYTFAKPSADHGREARQLLRGYYQTAKSGTTGNRVRWSDLSAAHTSLPKLEKRTKRYHRFSTAQPYDCPASACISAAAGNSKANICFCGLILMFTLIAETDTSPPRPIC
ncbi:hypothetical protein CEXT_711291 [Caerostris extrusa]|uniref:Uncharacterized protein n=1 Tax=Caerostris extrusa TaxID=172846 RepID=A0AAV4Y2V5_CAEEX|nr:hypothetical protein CEXT_711291 [Caerostris extrusa]